MVVIVGSLDLKMYGSAVFTKQKKINRSILWISGFNIFNGEILNHLSQETVREAIQRKIKQIKTNIENARLKNVSEDF